MYFGYDICPKCMDTLIERGQPKKSDKDFSEYSGRNCLVCGNKLVLACVGDKRIDNTLYKIILNEIPESDKREYVEILKKLDIAIPIEKLNDKQSVIFEGTAADTYIKMEMLDDTKMKYIVEPKFPFARLLYNKVCLCSKCGCETVQKMQEAKHPKGYIIKGFYCENCNEWIIYNSFSKLRLDDTIYQLVFSLKEINSKPDCEAKKELLCDLDNLTDKEECGDKIFISEKAEVLYSILQILIAIGVAYEISPPFKHEIDEYREFDEKLIEEILEFNKKYN